MLKQPPHTQNTLNLTARRNLDIKKTNPVKSIDKGTNKEIIIFLSPYRLQNFQNHFSFSEKGESIKLMHRNQMR